MSNPPLAMGLAELADWSTQQPFIDLMKLARPWTGHLEGQWGGLDHDDLEAGGYLDENGWPVAIPEEATGIEALLLVDQPPEATSQAGRYRVTWEGEGEIDLFVYQGENFEYGENEIRFDYAPSVGHVGIEITETDPGGTGDYIRNIEVVREDHIALHEAGALFNPDWIERIEDLRVLRFMDWMKTNNSDISGWSERPEPDDYTYTLDGAPAEVMVALANEVGADPWFTMPHLGTEEYMRAFATLVRDTLDPALRPYVEYSNELWNFQFDQTQWALEQAEARWGPDAPGDAGMQYAGMRAAGTAEIWDGVFGAAAGERLVHVISTQTGWTGLEEALLEAPLWVAEDPGENRPPAEYFDAYGVTGYFGFSTGTDEKAPTVLGWIEESRAAAEAEADAQGLTGAAREAHVEAHRYDLAVERVVADLRADSLPNRLDGLLPYHAAAAEERGLDLVMYEGGSHVVGVGSWTNDETLTEFFTHLNYTPEMGALYEELLAGWREAGGTLFNAFVDVAPPSKWGSWGALRHLDDENPRWDALESYNESVEAWWETRPEGTFADGVTREGTPGDDRLEGTPEEDFLIGGPGDDTLLPGGGSDGLHGGPGRDTAVLPGRRADHTLEEEAGGAVLAHGASGTSRLVSVETILFAGDGGDGTPGDDTLDATGGSDAIDLGAGRDTVRYDAPRAAVALASGGGGITVTEPGGATDSLFNVERVALADGAWLFDLGSADLPFLYRLYDASFGRTPDEAGLRFWHARLEAGTIDPEGLAGRFAGSAEFRTLYPEDSDEAFVAALYGNALRRPPDPEGLEFWLTAFASGERTRAEMLGEFADSEENLARNAENYADGVWVLE